VYSVLRRGSAPQVVEAAHACGTLVGMTAGDANVVTRHREDMWQVLEQGLDFLFANRYPTPLPSLHSLVCTASTLGEVTLYHWQ